MGDGYGVYRNIIDEIGGQLEFAGLDGAAVVGEQRVVFDHHTIQTGMWSVAFPCDNDHRCVVVRACCCDAVTL